MRIYSNATHFVPTAANRPSRTVHCAPAVCRNRVAAVAENHCAGSRRVHQLHRPDFGPTAFSGRGESPHRR
jgi:hypothetical protein